MDPQQTQQQVAHFMTTLLPIIFLIGAIFFTFVIFLFWRIFTKAGMSGALSLLLLLYPIGFLIVLCILAFADWKVAPVLTASPYLPPVYPPLPPPPAFQPPQV